MASSGYISGISNLLSRWGINSDGSGSTKTTTTAPPAKTTPAPTRATTTSKNKIPEYQPSAYDYTLDPKTGEVLHRMDAGKLLVDAKHGTYGGRGYKHVELPPDTKPPQKESVPTDAKISGGTFDKLSQSYYHAQAKYDKAFLATDTVDYSKSPTMTVKGGKDPGIKVPVQLLKDVVSAAKRNGIDPYLALAQVSMESSFGTDTGIYRQPQLTEGQNTRRAIMQGMDLDEPNRPQEAQEWLYNKGVPGIGAKRDKTYGYVYNVSNEKKINDFLDKHPEIAKQYQKHLNDRTSVPKGYNTYDAAFQRDKKGIAHYNPAPAYARQLQKFATQFRGDDALKEIVESTK